MLYFKSQQFSHTNFSRPPSGLGKGTGGFSNIARLSGDGLKQKNKSLFLVVDQERSYSVHTVLEHVELLRFTLFICFFPSVLGLNVCLYLGVDVAPYLSLSHDIGPFPDIVCKSCRSSYLSLKSVCIILLVTTPISSVDSLLLLLCNLYLSYPLVSSSCCPFLYYTKV